MSPIHRGGRPQTALSFTLSIGAALASVLAPSGASAQSDPFEAAWLGFNAGSSAYPGNEQPFERDPTAITAADFNGDGALDVAISNFEYAAPGGGTDGLSGFVVLLGQGDRHFGAAQHTTVSSRGCWDIESADFDADGDMDIAVSIANAFFEGNQVRIYLNDGNGGFPTFRSRSVADGPIGLASGDFDGDGHIDLAVASYREFQANGLISVLRGDGTGALVSTTTTTVEALPWKIEAADLDGDGDLDLAAAHQWHTVTVLRNQGAGTFTTTTYSGFFPNQGGQFYPCLTLADTDRDGDLDIFYSNTRSRPLNTSQDYIVYLRNDGASFTRAADIPATGSVDLVTGDLDGDGWPDLVTVAHSARIGDGPRVVLNDGSGGFLPDVAVPAAQGTFAVALGDADGDGDPELLTADQYSMALTVHENLGDGSFPGLPRWSTAPVTTRLDAGDVDGDGDLDVMTSTEGVGFPGALHRNLGDGTFGEPELYTHSTTYGRGVARAKLRDLNGDGSLDLLYNGAHTDYHDGGYNFYTALNDGTGSFGPIVQWFIGTCGNGDVDAFDIDEDGDLDVINCEELACGGNPNSANRLFISLNNGDGTFAPHYTIQISTGPHAILGGDFNEDGHVDLVTTHWMPYGERDFINVHLGNGDGTFQEELIFLTGQGPRWVVQGDFDGDGHVDLATANSGSGNEGRETITVRRGTGTGLFLDRTDYYLPFSADLLGATGLATGDPDGDGDLDLMATTPANGLAYYENDGSGTFHFDVRYGLYWNPWSPYFADFDGDGVEDIVLLTAESVESITGSAVSLLRGTGATPADAPSLDDVTAEIGNDLSRVVPNPFASSAQFQISVPSTQRVRIALFDAAGRAISTLHDGELETSVRHSFTLHGAALAQGVYWVRAEGETFVSERKVVHVRR